MPSFQTCISPCGFQVGCFSLFCHFHPTHTSRSLVYSGMFCSFTPVSSHRRNIIVSYRWDIFIFSITFIPLIQTTPPNPITNSSKNTKRPLPLAASPASLKSGWGGRCILAAVYNTLDLTGACLLYEFHIRQ